MSNATLGDGIKCVGEDLHEKSSFPGKLTMTKALGEKALWDFPCGCSSNKAFPHLHPWKGEV